MSSVSIEEGTYNPDGHQGEVDILQPPLEQITLVSLRLLSLLGKQKVPPLADTVHRVREGQTTEIPASIEEIQSYLADSTGYTLPPELLISNGALTSHWCLYYDADSPHLVLGGKTIVSEGRDGSSFEESDVTVVIEQKRLYGVSEPVSVMVAGTHYRTQRPIGVRYDLRTAQLTNVSTPVTKRELPEQVRLRLWDDHYTAAFEDVFPSPLTRCTTAAGIFTRTMVPGFEREDGRVHAVQFHSNNPKHVFMAGVPGAHLHLSGFVAQDALPHYVTAGFDGSIRNGANLRSWAIHIPASLRQVR